jgi:hypothetical protein
MLNVYVTLRSHPTTVKPYTDVKRIWVSGTKLTIRKENGLVVSFALVDIVSFAVEPIRS